MTKTDSSLLRTSSSMPLSEADTSRSQEDQNHLSRMPLDTLGVPLKPRSASFSTPPAASSSRIQRTSFPQQVQSRALKVETASARAGGEKYAESLRRVLPDSAVGDVIRCLGTAEEVASTAELFSALRVPYLSDPIESRLALVDRLEMLLQSIDGPDQKIELDAPAPQAGKGGRTPVSSFTRFEKKAFGARELAMLRTAVVATLVRDIHGLGDRPLLQRLMFNAAKRLWNDHQEARPLASLKLNPVADRAGSDRPDAAPREHLRMTVDARLVMADALTDDFAAITQLRHQSAELRNAMLSEEDMEEAIEKRNSTPLAASFPHAIDMLDASGIKAEKATSSETMQTRDFAMVVAKSKEWRIKNPDYGNERVLQELYAGLELIMTGQAVPLARLATHIEELFPDAMEKRWDRKLLDNDPKRLIGFASPMVSGFKDLGNFVDDVEFLKPMIIESRGEKGFQQYEAALKRKNDANRRLDEGIPMYSRDPAEAAEKEMSEYLEARAAGGVAKFRNHEIVAERKKLFEVRGLIGALKSGALPSEAEKLVRERLDALRLEDAAARPKEEATDSNGAPIIGEDMKPKMVPIEPFPNAGMRAEFAAWDALWDHVDKPESTEADWMNRLDSLDRICDEREINSIIENATSAMVEQLPDELQDGIALMSAKSRIVQNGDLLNSRHANAGAVVFRIPGEKPVIVFTIVDLGNAKDAGYGGKSSKIESHAIGNSRSRVGVPNQQPFVPKAWLATDYIGLTPTGIAVTPRGGPTAGVIPRAIRAEREALDVMPVERDPKAKELYAPAALKPSVESAFCQWLIPTAARERLADLYWSGGPNGQNHAEFPRTSGHAPRAAVEEVEEAEKRAAGLVRMVTETVMHEWVRDNPERARAASLDVAAGVQAVTGLCIDASIRKKIALIPAEKKPRLDYGE